MEKRIFGPVDCFLVVLILIVVMGISTLIGLAIREKLWNEKEPIFSLKQQVTYKVPKFYRFVCDGRGIIDDFYGDGTYRIISNNPDCPILKIRESDISPLEK